MMRITTSIVERARRTANGFKDLELAADEVIVSGDAARSKDVALELLRSEVHQARCVATFILGRLAAFDGDALAVLKQRVSRDEDWRVQEILAKAFDRFCADTGYETALPTIREWLSAASANTRRAVTEGLRIWTARPYFRAHPEAAVALLSPLRSDSSEYLRKSVGNALRDISKKHPDLIRSEVATWDLDQHGVRQVHKLATRLLTSSAA
jgi:3-methyladenine DNA glycosylase AlkD